MLVTVGALLGPADGFAEDEGVAVGLLVTTTVDVTGAVVPPDEQPVTAPSEQAAPAGRTPAWPGG